MSSDTDEKLITNAVHTAFIKYPEDDGGPNPDYEWILPEQSSHIAKAILLDLQASGFQNCEGGWYSANHRGIPGKEAAN